MKKFLVKITVLLLSILLISPTIYKLKKELKTQEELEFPTNSEVIVEEKIDTACDSIKILSADTVKADNKLKVLGQTNYSNNNAVSEVGIQTYVVLDDLALPLLPTFYDPNMALELIKDKCQMVVNELKTTYGLEDLSNENWGEYQKCLYDRFHDENKPDWYEETNDQVDDFIYFFEVYRLLSQNNYLVSLAASASSVHELLSNQNFLLNLSYYVLDDLVEENMIKRTKKIGGGYRVIYPETKIWSKVIKKIITWTIGITLILLMLISGKNDKISLKPGTYTLQNVERDVPGDFIITIYDDGTFQCYETPISSYIGRGHYSIEKDVVALKDDETGCTGDINYYRIVGGNLSFIRDDSVNYHFVPLEDGASFAWTSDVP